MDSKQHYCFRMVFFGIISKVDRKQNSGGKGLMINSIKPFWYAANKWDSVINGVDEQLPSS